MNLLESVLNAQGGAPVQQMASQLGISEDQAQTAIQAILPMLAGAAHQNATQEGGLGSLLGALTSGNHQQYVEDPSALGSSQAVDEGNGILSHLLGDKTVSRAAAEHVSQETGLDSSVIKKALPLVATLLMGVLSQRAASGGGLMEILSSAASMMGGGQQASSVGAGAGGGADILMGALGSLLGGGQAQTAQGGNSGMASILGLAAQFLARR